MPQSEKVSKASVDYGKGTWHRKCALCTMWRPPASCTLVEGVIRAEDYCNRFVRRSGERNT